MYFLLSVLYTLMKYFYFPWLLLENYQFDIHRLTWKNVALSANNILQRHSLNNFRAFVCSPMARVRRTQICRGGKSCRRQIVRNPRRERERKREMVHVPYSLIPRYRLPVLKTKLPRSPLDVSPSPSFARPHLERFGASLKPPNNGPTIASIYRGRLSAWRRARSTRLCFLAGAISRWQ